MVVALGPGNEMDILVTRTQILVACQLADHSLDLLGKCLHKCELVCGYDRCDIFYKKMKWHNVELNPPNCGIGPPNWWRPPSGVVKACIPC